MRDDDLDMRDASDPADRADVSSYDDADGDNEQLDLDDLLHELRSEDEASPPDDRDADDAGLDDERPIELEEPDTDTEPLEDDEASERADDAADAEVDQVDEADQPRPDEANDATPLIERVRPTRRPFVSRTALLWSAIGILAVAAIAIGATAFVLSARVAVPDVTGRSLGVARVEAARLGLELTVSERRFSTLPREQVLEQSPAPGEEVARGSVVSVVVSAGSEQFLMPDVVGDGLNLARGRLESRGLTVQVQQQASDEASGTVLSTNPSPNAPVQTGDIVLVTVATTPEGDAGLRPFKLDGRVFVLDPAPVEAGDDAPLEVTRRLRSLLEASGATVTSTRSAVDTGTAEAERVNRTKLAAPTAVVGLGVRPGASGGIDVQRLGAGTAGKVTTSTRLQQQIIASLQGMSLEARGSTAGEDAVLEATDAPSARVVLGSADSKDDQTSFRDPKWTDSVARSIYEALGRLYEVE